MAIESYKCEECNHAVELHDAKDGCQYERGDAYVSGANGGECLMAMGPCGCKAVAVELDSDLCPDCKAMKCRHSYCPNCELCQSCAEHTRTVAA